MIDSSKGWGLDKYKKKGGILMPGD